MGFTGLSYQGLVLYNLLPRIRRTENGLRTGVLVCIVDRGVEGLQKALNPKP